MPDHKPVMLVARKLPEAVEDRVRRDYDARLNSDDRANDEDDLVAAATEPDAILTCATEVWSAAAIERLPEQLRVIATFSVGFGHINPDAARARRIVAD